MSDHPHGMSPGEIVFSLRERGETIESLGRKSRYGKFRLKKALERPTAASGRIISNCLGIPAKEIWPDFYREDGRHRHEPRATERNVASERYGIELGARIRDVRGSESRAYFCTYLGLHPNTLLKYEKGERIPDAFVLSHISHRFHVNPGWLLTGSGPMYAEKPPDNSVSANFIDCGAGHATAPTPQSALHGPVSCRPQQSAPRENKTLLSKIGRFLRRRA